jgi:hypothetical protein
MKKNKFFKNRIKYMGYYEKYSIIFEEIIYKLISFK